MQRLASLFILLCVATTRPATTRAAEVVPKEDANALLHNPDMGWVLYENYPIDQSPGGSSTLASLPKEDFAEVDDVAVMFAWSDVERREDDYDFSKVDHAYNFWKKRGKRIQLRMSTESLLWWNRSNPPSGVGVPQYVLDRLPPAKVQRRSEEGFEYVVVDARDAFYRQRLEKFLAAVAEHYSEDARPVDLIDLRGFGLWGEWHRGFRYANLQDRREALCGVIDRFSAALPHNWLALSFSYDPDGPAAYYAGPTEQFDPAYTDHYRDFLRFSAFDHALTRRNVTWRRDGVGGAVHSNERKLCDEAFATRAKGPIMCEFAGGYAESKAGDAGWIPFKINDALSLHPNYINLLGYEAGDALAFIGERRDLFEHGLRNMGYRLVPTKVKYPDAISAGDGVTIESTWANRGVGRAMRDFHLFIRLLRDDGSVVAEADARALPTSKWIKGESNAVTTKVSFAPIAAGKFVLSIALRDPKDRKAIALPLSDADGDGGYRIGTITVH